MNCGYVLVVDSDIEWRLAAMALLTRLGVESIAAESGADALAIARHDRPALVLLDSSLGDVDGYETCRELRDAFGDGLPIILVSADRTEAHDRIAAFLIGADDHLAKPCDPGELIARVRRHLARGGALNGTQAAAFHSKGSNDFGLTRRELEILQRLAAGATPAAIASELFISPKTVASHLQRALSKMHVHSRVQAVALAYERGLIDTEAESELHGLGVVTYPEAAEDRRHGFRDRRGARPRLQVSR